MKTFRIRFAPLAALTLGLATAVLPSMPAAQSATGFDAMAVDVIKRAFRDEGRAKIAWLEQVAVGKA